MGDRSHTKKLSEVEVKRLIKKFRPRGTKISWIKGRKWWQSYVITTKNGFQMNCVYPNTHFMMLVFLHECAHIADGYVNPNDPTPMHVGEYSAEKTAMTWWQNEGYKVPPYYLETAKKYVLKCIEKDKKLNVKIRPHIKKWANRSTN